jgi:TonB family protein
VEKFFKSEPPKPTPDLTPVEKPNPKPTPKVDLHLVTRNAPKNLQTKTTDNSQQQARAINAALKNLRKNLAPGTVIDVPGTGSKSSANYRDALASIYYDAWMTPDDVMSDTPNAIVRITVATDGTVINTRIITPSGDTKVDDSIQRALERVPSVPPLPDQSKAQQDFTISFNLETKKMSE